MKKIISILCVFCLLMALTVPAFAAKSCSCGHDPVIYVHGFGKPIYQKTEDGQYVRIYEPTEEAFAKQNKRIAFAIAALLLRQYRLFADLGMRAAEELLGAIKCDANGVPSPDTGIYPESLPSKDVHGQMRETIADYTFSYDWRLSPVESAEKLHEYVEHIRALTGHNKVSFVCHSMGATVLASYLALYGSEKISNMICLTPAWQGISIMGSLLSGEAKISDKGKQLDLFLKSVPGITDSRLQSLIRFGGKSGLYPLILHFLQHALDRQFERVFYNCLRGMFGTMPGIWAFVPDSYYERAKAFTFGDDTGFSVLIEKIDYYHYHVQNRLTQLLQDAIDNGMQLAVVSGYGISSMPLSYQHTVQSDILIDTCYTSIGAVSMPFGETLPASHSQVVADGHNHISPDGLIDASGCAFPEYTWFVHGMIHFDYPTDAAPFVQWFLSQSTRPTVFTDEQWPQFIRWDGSTLSPVQ